MPTGPEIADALGGGFLPLLGALGLIFGSFATAASHRLPLGQSLCHPGSRCPSCHAPLKAADLMPVLSYLWRRGKCAYCHAPFSAGYLAIELATALVFVMAGARHGASLEAALLCGLGLCAVILSAVDFKHRIIPDGVQLWMAALGAAYRWQTGAALEDVAVGAGLGLALGAGLRWGYQALRNKEGLGMGDVKFLLVAGIWLPLPSWVPFLLIGGLLGIVTALVWRARGWGKLFPFGPALAASLLIQLWWPELGDWLRYFR